MEPRTLQQLVPAEVLDICRRLEGAGFRAWIVGGCVRDGLIADIHGVATRPDPADWDVATSALPAEVQRLFGKVVPTGIVHGTVTVVVGGVGYEVTTLRAEAPYSDGRRPDRVRFVDDITADLARRDFTVNAIAYDPLSESLVDPFGGIDDIRRRRLAAVGDPAERFAEDGLRVLRAARFVATLGFDLEEGTERAIEPSLASYRKVSAERIRDEWLKAMRAARPSRAFAVMKDHGLLAITAPELLESVGCEQNRYHAYDVWDHAMACMDACPPSPVLRVAGLLHDVGKPRSRGIGERTRDYTFYGHEIIGAEMARPMLERLRFSNADRDRIVGLVRHHLICYADDWTDAAVRRWLRRVTPELAEDLYALGRADAIAKGDDRDPAEDLAALDRLAARVEGVRAAGAAIHVRDLAIDGHDLIRELGLEPGKALGDVLRRLLEEVTEDPSANDRARLLARARDLGRA